VVGGVIFRRPEFGGVSVCTKVAEVPVVRIALLVRQTATIATVIL
jgi:hypothetical protein